VKQVILLGCILTALASAVLADANKTPNQVIDETAAAMASRLQGRKEYLSSHPDELYALIDEVLLPNFDTRYSGYLVLGKHWRTASEEQRSRFIDSFYNFLLRSYANGILEFDQDNIKILPARGEVPEKRTVVKTEMRLDDGTEIPVNYSLRETDAGWKVYDVRIEGVSYVQNYRNQFNAEISTNGLDAVIARLERETVALEIGGVAEAPEAAGAAESSATAGGVETAEKTGTSEAPAAAGDE
jgi:phospholipid transport system substrate-binding protein